MEVGLWSLALGRVQLRGLPPLHVAVARDGVALPVLRFLLLNEKNPKLFLYSSALQIDTEMLGHYLAVITPSAFVDQLANDESLLKVAFDFSVLLARVRALCLRRELRS